MKFNLLQKLPESPGVYLMKDARGQILYVGKAANLKKRVSSYFARPHDARIERLVAAVKRVDCEKKDTVIEALIREAELIKKLDPPFNIREKDDKSFFSVEITKERFPRVLLVRKLNRGKGETFGPFTSASALREALRIIRRIFPFNLHAPEKIGSFKRPCLDYEMGLCPGICAGKISRRDYLKNVKHIRLFLQGRKKKVVASLGKEMKRMSRDLKFEEAEKIKRQLFALKHIQDVSLISDSDYLNPKPYTLNPNFRIEGYDISNISGDYAAGGMVVFQDGKPQKEEYRLFKIRAVFTPNDTAMLQEIIQRRLRHREWRLPDLVLVDGGKGQVNAVRQVLKETGLDLPVVGIAKGPKRKRNDIIGKLPEGIGEPVLIRVRNEAHRFALKYHTRLRSRLFTMSAFKCLNI